MATKAPLELNTLEELFKHQLEDLYDAEKRLVEALPMMSQAASSEELKQAFDSHHSETLGQVDRLEEVFKRLEIEPSRETCQAMRGLIQEGDQVLNASGSESVRDAALIAAAQRVEHYEMAGYGSARSIARQLGHDQVADLLQQSLDEEGQADHKLTEIAQSSVNAAA